MKFRFAATLTLIALFSSCMSIYDIKLKKDGSALVSNQVYLISDSQRSKLEKSNFEDFSLKEVEDADTTIASVFEEYKSIHINNFKEFKGKNIFTSVQFTIDHINNLGPFMDPSFQFLQPQFDYLSNKLLITCPPYAFASNNDTDSTVISDDLNLNLNDFIYFHIKIKGPKSIKSVTCNNPALAHSFKGKNFILKSSMYKIGLIETPTLFEIEFK